LDGFLPLTALHARRVTLDFTRHLLLWSGSLKPGQSLVVDGGNILQENKAPR